MELACSKCGKLQDAKYYAPQDRIIKGTRLCYKCKEKQEKAQISKKRPI